MTESPRRHAELILERDSIWGDEDAEIVARAYLELLDQTAAPGIRESSTQSEASAVGNEAGTGAAA